MVRTLVSNGIEGCLSAMGRPLRRRVELLLAERAYTQVLAATAARREEFKPERCWAFYRLACYRSVVDLAFEPVTQHEILAKSVSLAACGYGARAREVALRLDPDRDLPVFREACERLAAFEPELALTLAERLPGNGLFKLALDFSTGRRDRVVAALGEPGGVSTDAHPDVLLLRANLARSPKESLDRVNAYLGLHGLTEITLANPLVAAGAANMRSARPERTGSIEGPLTSVVMTTFNCADRVSASIRSILGQSYRNIELIVVDDASTDDTADRVLELSRTDSRLRLIRRTRNAGTFVSKNEGIRQARGKFVTCHDSDDFAHQDRIARQVDRLVRDTSLVCTLTDLVRVDDDGIFQARQVFPLTRVNTCSLMFRRKVVLARAGRYEPVRTGADSEFVYRLKLVFGAESALRIRRPLTFAAHRDGSLTTSPESGLSRGPMPPDRLDYWEAWVARHVDWQSRLLPRLTGRYAARPLRP